MAGYGNYNQPGYGQGGGYNQQAGNPYAQGNPYTQQQTSNNPYTQQQSNQYGQQQGNPYAQQQPNNPYTQQQGNRYGQQNSYGQPQSNPYAQQGPQSQGSGAMEMGQVNGGAPGQRSQFAILEELNDLNRALGATEADRQKLQQLQKLSLADTDSSPSTQTNRQLDQLSSQITAALSNYVRRLNKIKATPGAGDEQNTSQINRTDRRLRELLQSNIKTNQEAETSVREQIERRVKITNPNATNEEIQAACEDPNIQVFGEALYQGNRRGEATTALREVQDRSSALRKIEKCIIEIAELTQQMNQTIAEHDDQVQEMNQKVEEAEKDTERGNKELTQGVDKARAARRKKWICFWICVAIVVIIVAVIAGYFGSQAAANKAANSGH